MLKCHPSQKRSLIFHASKCSSWERQKTKGCGPNGLGGLSKLKTWIVLRCFKICPASWGKSCLRLWKNMQAEEVAKTWKHMWPNWPLSIWLMIDLMTAFHVASSLSWLVLGGSSSMSPCVCTMPGCCTWHRSQVVTSRRKSSQVVKLGSPNWNSTARQQMTAG